MVEKLIELNTELMEKANWVALQRDRERKATGAWVKQLTVRLLYAASQSVMASVSRQARTSAPETGYLRFSQGVHGWVIAG